MILLILLLLVAERASCQSIRVTGNEEIIGKPDDNSILESIRERDTKPSSPRSRRAVNSLSSDVSTTVSSTNLAYESAMNQTIADYYAQRKAVMDRYYARRREIVDKFASITPRPVGAVVNRATTTTVRPNVAITTTVRPIVATTTTVRPPAAAASHRIFGRNASVATPAVGPTTVHQEKTGNGKVEDNRLARPAFEHRATDREDDNNNNNNNPTAAWRYRSNNWNPRISDRDSDIDLQPEASNTLERIVQRTVQIPGYYKLGDFAGTKDEKVVYQHNLGVGLKGSSQLDATFEAVIEGPYEITIVEAFPYANTRANFSWLGGGPGSNFVRLKLRGYENEGFSYSVKVWGVPKKDSR